MGASPKAVFLSYASQDVEAARRLSDALRAAGIEVWFDRSELRGGDAWDASIRRQIRECALFVPVISASTEARSEGYFRREWNLAVDRMLDMAGDQAFLLPVVIDDTAEATARVPDRFRERQWSRIEGGAASPDWARRVATLLDVPVPGNVSGSAAPPTAAPFAVQGKRRWIPAAAALVALTVAVAIGLILWKVRDASDPTLPASTAAVAVQDPKTIAVLPFDNLSGRPEDAYLADGLQEEILNALARVRDLKVISRTSTQEYRGRAYHVREIGQRLGVGTVLEGSIRRDGNTLRLTVQLIDARNDRHLLAANYDRDMTHVLDLQSAVARRVADALSATLTRHERGEMDRVATNNGDAYDRYLRAVALFRREVPNDENGLNEPMRLLQEALKFDPDYADALALLSQTHTWLFLVNVHPEDGAAARQAMERALAIDPTLPEALLARGLYAMYVTADLDQALADLSSVVQTRPNSGEAHSVLGFALRRKGRMDEALAHQVRAWELDPLNDGYGGAPLVTLLGLRRYPEAVEHARAYIQRFPNEARARLVLAGIESRVQNSQEPMRAALREVGDRVQPAIRALIESDIAVEEGRYADAIALYAGLPGRDPLERGMRLGLMYRATGDSARAETNLRAGLRDGLDRLKREPELARQIDFAATIALTQSLLDEHAAAVASIDALRARYPESREATNGPFISFCRSVILVRAGRADEGHAEVTRLMRVPFGSPIRVFLEGSTDMTLLTKDDPQLVELVKRPPRL